MYVESPLTWGRELKLEWAFMFDDDIASPLTWGRELKHQTGSNLTGNTPSPLTWGRELKLEFEIKAWFHHKVAPYMGA